jgi:hypothetical protein
MGPVAGGGKASLDWSLHCIIVFSEVHLVGPDPRQMSLLLGTFSTATDAIDLIPGHILHPDLFSFLSFFLSYYS